MTEDIQDIIVRSAKKALIDQNIVSDEQYLPKLIYNNPNNSQIVLSTVQEEIKSCNSFDISVAFITMGGICCLYNELQTLEEKGIPGRIVTTNFLFFNDPKALKQLQRFSNLTIRVFEGDLHTKGYIFHKDDHDTILVGSSNLTDSALKCNQEWNIRLSSINQGELVKDYTNEFERLWSDSIDLTDDWIKEYEKEFIKEKAKRISSPGYDRPIIKPTKMQEEALAKIKKIRSKASLNPEMNRALLISATGTGKTYISAFDVKNANPKKMLFMVHRGKILNDAMDSYKNVLGESNRTYGIYKGSKKEKDVDYLFASVNTLTKHLDEFDPYEFDYIVCDEAHHIVTEGQKRIIDYFKPKFILGMTATPERTGEGNKNVYKVFNYNIPYEIRLSEALEEKLVCPFHYFGIGELYIDGNGHELSDFSKVSIEERTERIVEEIENHPYSGDRIRGLIFCGSKKEAYELEKTLSKYYKVKALTGDNSEEEREEYFTKLEADERLLDFIISIDVLNEGIDLPRVNMIVMLRPTQSSIIFIQQLGRGLRKRSDKDFVTIIDFIGNYDNNYNIPIALFGDNTRNKENLRRRVMLGNRIIPGASTVSFDEISKERIFRSINSGRINRIKEMKSAYEICSNKIGHEPSLTELYLEKSLDPRAIVSNCNNLNEFRERIRSELFVEMSDEESLLLSQITKIVSDGLRPNENLIIRALLEKGSVTAKEIADQILNDYNINISLESIIKSVDVLRSFLKFINISLCDTKGDMISITDEFRELLSNSTIRDYVEDAVECGLLIFETEYLDGYNEDGFVLNKLYSRFAFCRLQNLSKNNVGVINGYKIMGKYCPLFVTYKKIEGKDQMYSDHFIDNKTFFWESRYPRYLTSKELAPILNSDGMIIQLFIQKDGSEGTDYYYCGKVHLKEGSAKNSETIDPKGNLQPVVSMEFLLEHQVSDDIFYYLTG